MQNNNGTQNMEHRTWNNPRFRVPCSVFRSGGFTLVEMIVSIGLFTIVLFISSNAFLAVLNADRKSRSTRIAMDSLNISLEDMARRIKTGTSYYCGGTTSSTGTMDCSSGGTSIAFTEQDGITRTAYRLDGTTIKRQVGNTGVELPVVASEIIINKLIFIVRGSDANDSIQPYVTILIDGATTGKVTSSFNVQTTVTQRSYDI
ncbi:MAG: prepilin-type N-terminal cleavage/methylation domain-containing protein [Candidatus Yonathbacteria bacterium]|nr:prepilin-type N-terminal cleavage/methylation domain-containing protein [Candidatus Yonathbacteria bacterium]